MARGKKLNLFIGADIEDGWSQIQTPKKPKVSNEILEPSKHFLIFQREKRKGKVVTLVGTFQLSKADSSKLLKSLKKKIGCGGTYKDNFMEFQGELQEKLRELLSEEGFRFKHKST